MIDGVGDMQRFTARVSALYYQANLSAIAIVASWLQWRCP